MVDEGLGFAGTFGDAEDVKEELFEDAEVGFAVERGVEGEDWAGAFETVSCEVKLFHGVY